MIVAENTDFPHLIVDKNQKISQILDPILNMKVKHANALLLV